LPGEVAEPDDDPARERLRVARRDERPVLAGGERLAYLTQVAGDHGDAGGEVLVELERREREARERRVRQEGDVRGGEHDRDLRVRPLAEPVDARRETGVLGRGREPRALGPVARDREVDAVGEKAERVDRDVDAVPGAQGPDER